MAQFTEEQKLARARMALMNHKTWCLYSGLLMIGKLSISDQKEMTLPEGIKMPFTARTNGRDVEIGREFIKNMSDAELRFLLLHENEHKALRQMTTYAFLHKISPTLCNVAMDMVVNNRLVDADGGEKFIEMPPGGCYDPKFRGWSTKQVFDFLYQKLGGGGKGKGKSGAGNPLDDHDMEGAEALTAEEKAELKQDVETAIRQGGLLAGKDAANARKKLEEVLDSQIRWQEILAEFIKSVTKGRDNSSWAKINRRWVSSGLYLPSAVSETVGGLLIAGDASGSTWSGNQLAGFLGEAKAIIDDVVPEFVDFIWWDTAVNVVYHFEPENYATMIETIKAIQGGGGTTPTCITNWIKKQEPRKDYVAAIVLSDGQVGSDWGQWSGCGVGGGELPVLWCINTKGITSPVGQTVYIEDTMH